MQHAYRTHGQVTEDGGLVLAAELPFAAGEQVEVIVVAETNGSSRGYSLRGSPIHYVDPTGPVAADDWDAAG